MKNNNKILYISIAILVLAVGILFGTYAYYQTTISGTISGNVAKWSFKANGQASSFNLNVGNLYPGVSDTYNIELSAEDSDLDVYYELFVKDADVPFFYYLYWDSGYTESVICNVAGRYGTIPAGSKITIPLYFNWPYSDNNNDNWIAQIYGGQTTNAEFSVIGQQLTGYTGTTPMYFTQDYFNDLGSSSTFNYSNGYIYESCLSPS
ncbi:MAG: hypothetical protein IJB71_01510 [Bacilli bacterium]|nr:hypothetical protein [Bacilli bacterium]